MHDCQLRRIDWLTAPHSLPLRLRPQRISKHCRRTRSVTRSGDSRPSLSLCAMFCVVVSFCRFRCVVVALMVDGRQTNERHCGWTRGRRREPAEGWVWRKPACSTCMVLVNGHVVEGKRFCLLQPLWQKTTKPAKKPTHDVRLCPSQLLGVLKRQWFSRMLDNCARNHLRNFSLCTEI